MRRCLLSSRLCWNKPNCASRRRRKKDSRTLNGKRPLHIKTRHGAFVFAEQTFKALTGEASGYLRLSGQQSVSVGLEEFCLFCCTRMSYDTVVSVVERMTGSPLVCSQTLCHWVKNKAARLDAALATEVASACELPAPALAEGVDIYDPQAEEVLVFCDGIGVKAQKPTHEKAGEARREKPDKRHETDVMLFEGQDARFRYLAGSTDKKVSLVDVAGAYLRTEWGERRTPLPLVALTDGAKKIRQDLATLFGSRVRIILDWFHLAKRVYEHLSMRAHSRAEREEWEHTLLGFLW